MPSPPPTRTLDWSERGYHLKGLVGARILDRLLERGWLKSVPGSRALHLTPSGRAGLSETFQIEIDTERPQPTQADMSRGNATRPSAT